MLDTAILVIRPKDDPKRNYCQASILLPNRSSLNLVSGHWNSSQQRSRLLTFSYFPSSQPLLVTLTAPALRIY